MKARTSAILCAIWIALALAYSCGTASARRSRPAPLPTSAAVILEDEDTAGKNDDTSASAPYDPSAYKLRVLVYKGAGPIKVSSDAGFDKRRGTSAEISAKGHKTESFVSKNGIIGIEGKKYRGEINILRQDGTIYAVNTVNLEDYLRGVVPKELLCSKTEAVKAQAVVARTYAWGHRSPEADWDVRDDTGHQVYGGIDAEHKMSDDAIEATAGLVLCHNGELACQALYHSSCGGMTESNFYVFGSQPISYLAGVTCGDPQNPWCKRSSYSRWEAEWTPEELGQELSKYLRKSLNRVKSLEIAEASPSGRVVRLIVHFEKGDDLLLSYDEIRRCLRCRNSSGNMASLPSTRFTVEETPGKIKIAGSGWGHGTGMCQWGAIGMAEAGFGFEEILKYYYQGTSVVSLGTMANKQAL